MGHKTRDTRPDAGEDPDPIESSPLQAELEEGDAVETLESLRAQRDDFLSRWQRAQADYKNARRRGLAEQEAETRRALQPLLEGMLLVLDYLEMALSCPATNDESRGIATGVQLTRDQLVAMLERNGVSPIEEDKFDPALHQAVDTVPAEGMEPGTIVETRRRGFRWGDTVLRFGHVVVAQSEEAQSEEAQSEEQADPAADETSER